MKENDHTFFQNRGCRYFPCHAAPDPEHFNCLFCYCPLYALGQACGGQCSYTDRGVKDCTRCALPHTPEGYGYVLSKFPQLARLAGRTDRERQA